MSIGDVISLAALCLTIVATGIGTTWYIASLFWAQDVRLARIEEHLSLNSGRQETQRWQSAARVVGKLHDTKRH